MATEYPLPNVGGPKPSCFYEAPETFKVTTSEYDDGGKDFALQVGGNGLKTWHVDYATLNEAEATILDAHVLSACYSEDEGSAFGFNMRDMRTNVLHSGVHYAPGGYQRGPHKVKTIQSRKVILVKHP